MLFPHRVISSSPRRGATLVEMLIVVAGVLLLMALAMGVSRPLVYRSKLTRCLQYQRQIGVAMHAYAADRQGRFPGFDGGKRSSLGNQRTIAQALMPYVHDTEIFACPGGLGRIFNKNTEGWYDWVYTEQKNRTGYWHVYINPDSEFNAALADTYARNDRLTAESKRVALHCYYAPSLEQTSHAKGETNVLRLDGSSTTWLVDQYNRSKNYHSNFEKQQ